MSSTQQGRGRHSRLNSAMTARTDYSGWSQWGEDMTEQSPLSPTEDLADLVHNNDLVLSVLQRESPMSPARYQADNGSIYYEYDDDWVSTVSPASHVPSRRFPSISSRFGSRRQPNQYALSPIEPIDEDGTQSGGQLHPARSIARRGTRGRRLHSVARHGTSRWHHLLQDRFQRHPSVRSPIGRPLLKTGETVEQEADAGWEDEGDTDYEGALESMSDHTFLEQALDPSSSSSPFTLSLGPSVPMSSRRTSHAMGVSEATDSDATASPTYRASTIRSDGATYMADDDAQTGSNTPIPNAIKYWVSSVRKVEFPRDSKSALLSEPKEEAAARSFATLRSSDMNSSYTAFKESYHSTAADAAAADAPGAHGPEAVAPVKGLHLVAMTVALALAVFVVGMDVNIISTAIPHITADFDSLDDIGWYGSAFLMTTCVFQISWGRLYTLLPVKWTFAVSLTIFELGSLICGVSPNSPVFILGRAVQGVGVAGMLSGALIIMSLVVPLAQRSLLGGIIGAMEGVAMISGPLIGGVLTGSATWRWCFYINLPIGAVVLVVILLILRVPPQPRAPETAYMTLPQRTLHVLNQLDLYSTAVLIPAIVCVLLALQWGGTNYPWGSLGIILLFLIAGVLLAVLVYMQRLKGDQAMIPPRIIKQRTILAGFWFLLCTSSALVVMAYFVSRSLKEIPPPPPLPKH